MLSDELMCVCGSTLWKFYYGVCTKLCTCPETNREREMAEAQSSKSHEDGVVIGERMYKFANIKTAP